MELQLGGEEKKKTSTKVKKATLNPVFNEAVEIPVTAAEAQLDASGMCSLELTVTAMDKDTVGSDDFLGDVAIDLCTFFAEADGGWTGSSLHPKTYAFADSSARLGKDEQAVLEDRRGKGSGAAEFYNPYGTVQLLLSFRAAETKGKGKGKGRGRGSG